MLQKRKCSTSNGECSKSKKFFADENENESVSIIDGSQNEDIRCGTIEKMVLKNFMCHSHLRIDFNSRINFIIGRNGSGKSALLTALVVGLGGRATNTNRGKSIREFIKAGQMVGAVEITLSNSGPEAYNPSVYGEKITIIRQFSANTSSYKIKNQNNSIVSTSAKDVIAIREAFNIQIDNPVCLLNQDVSRSFLNSNDPKKKYELFMSATNLESIIDYHERAKQEQTEIEKLRANKTEEFNSLKQKLEAYKNKLEQSKLYSSYKLRLNNLKVEKIWCSHKELCSKKETLEQQQQQKDEQRKEFEEKIDRLNKNILGIKAEITSLNVQIDEIKKSSTDLDEKSREIRVKYMDLDREANNKKTKLNDVLNTIESRRKWHDSLLKRIEGLEERNKMIEEQKLKHDQQMVIVKKQLEEINAQLTTKNEELSQRKHSYDNARNKQNEVISEINKIEDKIRDTEALITTLKKNKNALTLYGKYVPNFLEILKANKNRFSELPRGPIGSFISVKNIQWIPAIENILSPSILGGYCVSNHKDHSIFTELFKKYYPRERMPQVIISDFQDKVFNYTKNMAEAPPNCYACIKMLEITDPVVTNCLIDQLSIETILLIPEDQQCMEMLSSKENRPKSCHMAVTKGCYIYYPAPSYRSYSARTTTAKFLQADVSVIIKEKQRGVAELRDTKDNKQKEVDTWSVNVKSQLREKNLLAEDIKVLEKKRSTLNSKHDKLEAFVMEEPLQDTKLLDTIKDIKQQISELEIEAADLKEQIKHLEKSLNEQKHKESEMKKISRDTLTRIEPIKILIVGHETELSKKTNNIERFHTFVKKFEASTAEQKITIKNLEAEIAQLLATVPSDPPNDNIRTRQEIEKEEKMLTHAISVIDRDQTNDENIQEAYDELKRKYDKYSEFFEVWCDACEQSKISITQRVKDYKKMQQKVGETVRGVFHKILSLRGFKGDLDIDHKKMELHLHVQTPTNMNTSGDTRTLSGGERSYSTVSFIMALWKCVRFPFFFLDEFDVFMDKMNRRTVMDLLCNNAKESIGIQFAFLTPVDVTIEACDLISIHRMKDPRTEAVNGD